MQITRSYPLVEIHFALWGVLSVPLGFAGLFFAVPGLKFAIGVSLLAISGLLIFYVIGLTRWNRVVWILGVIAHALLLAGAIYYVPRWPALLAWPLAVANLYSLGVLLVYRRLWSGGSAAVPAAA